jgi:hypothetical protein
MYIDVEAIQCCSAHCTHRWNGRGWLTNAFYFLFFFFFREELLPCNQCCLLYHDACTGPRLQTPWVCPAHTQDKVCVCLL